MHKISTLIFYCITGMIALSLPLCGEEFHALTESDHVLPGTRPISNSEWLKIQEERARQEQENPEGKIFALAEEKQDKKSTCPFFASFVSPQAVTYYTHSGTYHYPDFVSSLGETIKLEDGSHWSVHTGDRYKTFNWLTSDVILITPNHAWFSSYMFCLTNKNTGVAVQANLVLGPVYDGSSTHWITWIDYFTEELWLEDKSKWKISGFDASVFNKWNLNDTIIIGVNDGFLHTTKPNILINVNTISYTRASCTY